METTPRNLERLLADRNSTLSSVLVRIRALANERRAGDRDFGLVFQMAEDAIAGAPAGATSIAASFKRWHELWTAKYPGDIPDAATKERRTLEAHIIGTRAVCLPDVLAKVRLLREQEKGGDWLAEDDMLASIAADIEHLATGGAA